MWGGDRTEDGLQLADNSFYRKSDTGFGLKKCLFYLALSYFQCFGTDFPYGILSASFQTSGIKSFTPRHPYSFSFFRNHDFHPNL
jgi:hypothetical protein